MHAATHNHIASTKVECRVDPALKESTTRILDRLGLSMSDAIRMFLHQVEVNRGIPFDLRIPNDETLEAIKEIREGRTEEMKDIRGFFSEFM